MLLARATSVNVAKFTFSNLNYCCPFKILVKLSITDSISADYTEFTIVEKLIAGIWSTHSRYLVEKIDRKNRQISNEYTKLLFYLFNYIFNIESVSTLYLIYFNNQKLI
jgi:hypothetical protein